MTEKLRMEKDDTAGKARAKSNARGASGRIPCNTAPRRKVKLPKRQNARGYRDPMYPYKYVEEAY